MQMVISDFRGRINKRSSVFVSYGLVEWTCRVKHCVWEQGVKKVQIVMTGRIPGTGKVTLNLNLLFPKGASTIKAMTALPEGCNAGKDMTGKFTFQGKARANSGTVLEFSRGSNNVLLKLAVV